MNIHHLELFYYVARNGGISQAVRRMPYGIQQPAISSQIRALEDDLGSKLFDRRPFKLTPAGQELMAHIEPFFSGLDALAKKLRQPGSVLLRIGGAEIALRDHLPAILNGLRRAHPHLRLALRSGYQSQLQAWLEEKQIDVAFTPLESKPPTRVKCQPLIQFPLQLLVRKDSPYKTAQAVLGQDKIEEPLISLPPSETISRLFQAGLQKLEVEWPVAIEASSLELIQQYVANGYGIGVGLDLKNSRIPPGIRTLPLEGFDPLEIAVLWRGEQSALVKAMIEETQAYVRRTWPSVAQP